MSINLKISGKLSEVEQTVKAVKRNFDCQYESDYKKNQGSQNYRKYMKVRELTMKPIIIAVANQKGGVGKTTTARAILTKMAEKGFRCLGIDLDSQGNLSQGFGIDFPEDLHDQGSAALLAGYLRGERDLLPYITRIESKHSFDLLVGNDALDDMDELLIKKGEGVSLYTLKDALDAVQFDKKYQYVVIDCKPSITILTKAAMVAANGILIPVEPKYYSEKGLNRLLSTIYDIRRQANPRLEIYGVLPNKVDDRQRQTKEFYQLMAQCFPDLPMYKGIPQSVSVSDTDAGGYMFARRSKAAIAAFDSFAEEFLQRLEERRNEQL